MKKLIDTNNKKKKIYPFECWRPEKYCLRTWKKNSIDNTRVHLIYLLLGKFP